MLTSPMQLPAGGRPGAQDRRSSDAAAGGREASIGFVPGQAGLPTLRLELGSFRSAPDSADATIRGTFTDSTFADRIGWREVVVVGSGLAMLDSSVSSASISDELRSYPDDGLDDPIDIHEATFRARLTSRPDAVLPTQARELVGECRGDPSQQRNGQRRLRRTAGRARQPRPGCGARRVAGRGKTLVAAYLIRGTPRQALTLGVTVAVTHTIGVFVLGAVVLGGL